MRKIILLMILGALAVGLLATPAQAATRVDHSGGGYGLVRDKQWMQVCDTEVDGNQVWIGYHTYIFPPTDYYYWQSARPDSGSCTQWHGANHPISEFRVCITDEGCTAFRPS